MKNKKLKEATYRSICAKSDKNFVNRILICIPTLGRVRMEWALARYGQIIPTNWSQVDVLQWMTDFSPMGYMVAEARNACCQSLVELDMEWILFIDDDVCLPPDAFVKINTYMREAKYPVVSGLYFTKSIPPEPLIYRGRGTSFYDNWKTGDKVWVDGIPMGCTLIHGSVIKLLWEESEEYRAGSKIFRRIFETPAKMWMDPETRDTSAVTGTEDLTWCTRVMEEKILQRAGWEKHCKKYPKWPFLLDTSIFCQHIDPNGRKFPGEGVEFDHGRIINKRR